MTLTPEQVLARERAKQQAFDEAQRREALRQRWDDVEDDPYYLLGVRIAQALERVAVAYETDFAFARQRSDERDAREREWDERQREWDERQALEHEIWKQEQGLVVPDEPPDA